MALLSSNILIVDDDPSTQRAIAEVLERHGCRVAAEDDGERALDNFQAQHFDAVLLAVVLPGTSGYEILQRLRSMPHGRTTPILLMSGEYRTALHQREAVEKHGAFAFLEKPIDEERLLQTLQSALGDAASPPAGRRRSRDLTPVEEDLPTGEMLADDAQREEVKTVNQTAPNQLPPPGGLTVAADATGDFSERAFAEVLATLYRARATGALHLQRERVKKIVYVRDGTPELVKSNLLVECLGRILVREKMIAEADCAESLRRMRATGRMQGTVLVEMGCISPHNLQYALHTQMVEKLYDVFRWEQGTYTFEPEVRAPAATLALGMTCAQLIHEGVRRAYGESRLSRVFADVEHRYVHPSDQPLYALQDAGLGPDERALLFLADGHKTVGTLRALGVLPPLETDRLLYAMRCAQMIELREWPSDDRPRLSFSDLAAALQGADASGAPKLPPPLPRSTSRTSAAPVLQPTPAPMHASEPQPLDATTTGKLLPDLPSGPHVLRGALDTGLRERLAQRVASMQALTHFEVLGVPPTASDEEIERAFARLAHEHHPDKHGSSASAEVRDLAKALYEHLVRAHATLSDPDARQAYERSLSSAATRSDGGNVSHILAAEGKFQRGEELLRQGSYAEAHRLFREAISLYAEEGEFYAYLGWSLFQADPSRAEEAERTIEHALAISPRLDKAYLFLGYVRKATGRPDKAEKQFERALQCNPDCTEALRELRLLGRPRR